MGNKLCNNCHEVKDVSLFYRRSASRDGYAASCKKCSLEYQKKRSKLKKDIIKDYKHDYYLKNKEKILHQTHEYKKGHKVKRIRNKEERRRTLRRYRERHRVELNNREREYKKSNINYKIASNLRSRIRDRIKHQNGEKSLRSWEYIGCSIAFLKTYLESLWTEGMDWSNYNFHGWSIDHIKPCASFNLKDKEQQKRCFHYTNLQPMWHIDNMRKGSLYDGRRTWRIPS
jgi:hypothetical protein